MLEGSKCLAKYHYLKQGSFGFYSSNSWIPVLRMLLKAYIDVMTIHSFRPALSLSLSHVCLTFPSF